MVPGFIWAIDFVGLNNSTIINSPEKHVGILGIFALRIVKILSTARN
jgi:hypothetical protein